MTAAAASPTPARPTPAARVRVIGRCAQAALAPGAHGRVVATFARSLYVATDRGLACLGGPEIGAGPLNAPCAGWPAGDALVDETVSVDAAGLRLGDRLVRLDGAEVWSPPALPGPPDPTWRARLAAALGDVPPPGDGLAPLVSLALGRAPSAATPLLVRVAPRIAALQRWLAAPGEDPPDIAPLVGLGPGLTPSGDDLLGGLLVALRALGATAAADRLAAAVMAEADVRTGAISRAHLAAAALGEGNAALHATLTVLARPDGEVTPALRALAMVGHTSGWDALAGAVLAFASATPEMAQGELGGGGVGRCDADARRP